MNNKKFINNKISKINNDLDNEIFKKIDYRLISLNNKNNLKIDIQYKKYFFRKIYYIELYNDNTSIQIIF